MRRIASILDEYQELEKQEIFLSDLKSLNDPMDGFIQFFWKGDRIIWKNLLRHYLLCMEHVLLISRLTDDKGHVSASDIPVFKTLQDLPTEEYRSSFTATCDTFFANPAIQKYLDFLASRKTPVYATELTCHLKTLHFIALASLLDAHRKLGFSSDRIPSEFFKTGFDDFLSIWRNNRAEIEKDDNLLAVLFEAQIHSHRQLSLIQTYNQYDEPRGKITRFLLLEFTEAFVERIRELAYPRTYVACFSSDCTNPSFWGHYGDGHRGVCLKFKTLKRGTFDVLPVNMIVGWGSAPIRGLQPLSLQKVNYTREPQVVDFFRSLGNLPLATLDKYWYSDESGKRSIYALSFKSEADRIDWQNKLWDTHTKCMTSKLPDWEQEHEYRIIVPDFMHSLESPEDRKLRYDFETLEGIVFGFRTATDEKVRIMKIVEKKCLETRRKDFKFFQAEYDARKGQMRIDELNLLKVELP